MLPLQRGTAIAVEADAQSLYTSVTHGGQRLILAIARTVCLTAAHYCNNSMLFCRYYTLVTVRHLAEEIAVTLSSEPHQGAPGQSSAVSVAREQAHDLMRTLLDVLLRVAPAAASKEDWQAEGGIQSWCGAAEVLR